MTAPIEVQEKHVKEAMNRVASTEDGQIFFRLLLTECGFQANIMSETDANVTNVYAAKRGVYAKLRNYIDNEHLKKIEYDYKIVPDKVEEVKKTEPKAKRTRKKK